MSTRQQNVRTYSPVEVARFDDQFWPILMALCITSAILAATLVTLLSGFWMWFSLLALPAAVTGMIITLLLTGNRRLRRSFQLAIILSLAGHCIFVIYAKQTRIFTAGLPAKETIPHQVQPNRSIRVAHSIAVQPWLKENKVPKPETPEVIPEKTIAPSATTARVQTTSPKANANPEHAHSLQRRKTQNTVAHLGKNRSAQKRRTRDEPITANEKVGTVPIAPGQRTPDSMALQPNPARLSRNGAPQPSAANKSTSAAATELTSAAPKTERQKNRTTDWETKQVQTYPRESETTPAQVSTQPTRLNTSRQTVPSPMTGDSTLASLEPNLKRDVTATAPPINKPQLQKKTNNRSPQSLVRRKQALPNAVPSEPTPTNVSRMLRAKKTNPKPLVEETVDKASQTPAPAMEVATSEFDPQPVSLERSKNGLAGTGNTPNLARANQSRTSSSITASDALKRRQEVSQDTNPNSLSLRQKSNVPRISGAAEMPRAVNRPDTIPIASRTALEKPTEWSASSSSALSQSNSTAKRGKSSLAKGSGSVDMGPTKIVSDSDAQRVSGGGRPKIQPRQSDSMAKKSSVLGRQNPNLMAEQPVVIPNDQASRQASEIPTQTAIEANEESVTRTGSETAGAEQAFANADSLKFHQAQSTAHLSNPNLERVSDRQPFQEQENQKRDRRGEMIHRATLNSTRTTEPSLPAVAIEIARMDGPETDSSSPSSASSLQTEPAPKSVRSTATQATDRKIGERSQQAVENEIDARKPQMERSAKSELPSVAARNKVRKSGEQKRAPSVVIADELPQALTGNKGVEIEEAFWSEKSAGTELKRKSRSQLVTEIADDSINAQGSGQQWEPDAGLDSRRASKNSPDIRPNADTRFRRETMGSAPTVDAAPVVSKEAFRARGEPSQSRSAPQTEESIELGLAYLARQQLQDGSWTLHGIPEDDSGKGLLLISDTAATGLAILAFQGAGFNHREFKYANQLKSAIDWLMENQKESGELYIDSNSNSDNVCRFYSHGIAALALCEAYGMTQDGALRIPAQRALDYIANTQNQKLGGWRYRTNSESDTSVTGWMMMAMQSGRLAGLRTDEKTWEGIKRWLRLAQSPDEDFLFRYNPYALDKPTTRHGRNATPCMTSVGLLMNMYIGWNRQDPRYQAGAQYLLDNLPNDSTITQRDTYYWYYSTQIMRHIGGDPWDQWHRALHPMLVGSQIQNGEMAGSWDPLNPVPDRWGAQAGRLYVTTMNLLSLEVDYRLLPLYDETKQEDGR